MPVKKLTAIELKIKIADLRQTMLRAQFFGHSATEAEARNLIRVFSRRLIAAKKREEMHTC